MRRFGVVLLLALSSCTGGGKPPVVVPTPPPTPEPTPPPSSSLLLSRNATQFTDPAGKPVDLKGTARCCFTDDSVEDQCDPGWALVSRCAIKDTADRAGAGGMIHLRLGPYRVQPDWGAEQNSAGSPYMEVNGKADLTQWDPKFEAYLDDKATYAASLGVRLEVDLIDGWGIKWQKWRPDQFPQGHPWMPQSNTQGQNWITSAGTSKPAGVHEAWVRHAVDMLGEHDNLIWQVGNEDEQIPGIVAAWETGTCDIVHDQEMKRGFKRHLCGSNAPSLAANNASIDFLTTHDDPPFSQANCQDVTRPCRQNEDNSRYTGDMWGSMYCEAKSKGLYRDLWRAEMSRTDFNRAFEFLKNGCSGATPVGCYNIPNVDAVQVLPKPPLNQTTADAVNAAMVRLHPECHVGGDCPVGVDLQTWLNQVTAEARKGDAAHSPICAGIQTDNHGPVDEGCFGTEQECQGGHVYACPSQCPESAAAPCGKPGQPVCADTCRPGCTGGKARWFPGAYNESDTWRRPGALTTALSITAASTPDWKHGRDKVARRGRARAR